MRDGDRLRYSPEARRWLFWLGDLPDLVVRCPGCGGALPTMEGVVERLVLDSPPEGWGPSDVEC